MADNQFLAIGENHLFNLQCIKHILCDSGRCTVTVANTENGKPKSCDKTFAFYSSTSEYVELKRFISNQRRHG